MNLWKNLFQTQENMHTATEKKFISQMEKQVYYKEETSPNILES